MSKYEEAKRIKDEYFQNAILPIFNEIKHFHWIVRNKMLCAWENSGNMYSEIATVENTRAVNQLIEYAHLGEDVEHIADMFAGNNITSEQASKLMVQLVKETIRRTL